MSVRRGDVAALSVALLLLACDGQGTNPIVDSTALLPPTHLRVVDEPGQAVSGVPLARQPVVHVQNTQNGRVTWYRASVTVVIASGSGTLSGTTTVTAAGGIATFSDLQIDGVGVHTLRFTASELPAETSASFTVTQTAASLEVQTQPAGGETGLPLATQPTIRLLDLAGLPIADATIPVTAAIANGAGTLLGTTTVSMAAGVAAFNDLAIVGGGPHALKFSSTNLETVRSADFNVVDATQLAVTEQPENVLVDSTFTSTPTVELRSETNAVMRASTAAVTVAIASGAGRLFGTTTVNAVNGVARFPGLRVNAAGVHRLVFTSGTLPTTTSAAFDVLEPVVSAPPSATAVSIQTQPGGAVSGMVLTIQPVVRLVDMAGGPTASTASVTASVTAGVGTLRGTATVNAVDGVPTFTDLRIDGAGAHRLTFSAAGLSPATSNTFTVTQVAVALDVEQEPAGATSGSNLVTQPRVRVRDALNAVVQGSTAAVTATLLSGGGTLSGTTTVNAVDGIATFTNLRIAGVGPHVLQFTSPGLSSATASALTVIQAIGSLGIQTQPAGSVSGLVLATQPTVQLLDGAGLLNSTATAAVTASLAGGTASLLGTTTVTAVAGVATFTNLRIDGVGQHSLVFSSPGLASVSASAVEVTQNEIGLVVEKAPGGAETTVAFSTQPVIGVVDNAGLRVTAATTAVTATLASGSGTLGGTTTVIAVNGLATFTDLSITGTGAHTLRFSATGLQPVTTDALVVTQTAAALSMQAAPAGAVSGATLTTQPQVAVRDARGALVTGSAIAITATIASGSGVLQGTTTVSAEAGVATFTNLRVDGAGPHVLTFSAPGLTPVTSASFTVTQTAVALTIQTAPGGATSGAVMTIQPRLQIRDPLNAVVLGSTAPVTAAITSGTGVLAGTTTVSAIDGVATFTNLRVDGAGTHVLTFTTPGLAPVTAASFTVAQQATSLAVLTQPAGASSGSTLTTQPVVEVRDLLDSRVAGSAARVTAVLTSGSGTLLGSSSVNAADGVATFANLRVDGIGPHTITFTSPDLMSVASASFTVAHPAQAPDSEPSSADTVTLAGGVVRVVVPAGAVPGDVDVTATTYTGGTAPTLVAGTAFDLAPAIALNAAVVVTLQYALASLPAGVAESELGIYARVGSAWVKVPGSTINVSNKSLSASITSLGTFAILGAPVTTVTVTPSPVSVAVGAVVAVTATPRDAEGNVLPNRAVTWSSDNPGHVTVNASGVVTAGVIGSANVMATSEGVSGQTLVTVVAAGASNDPVASVTLPASPTMTVGGSTTLSATLRDATGAIVTPRPVTWTSSNEAVATVNSSGAVSAASIGTTTITATSEGISGTTTLTVTAVPQFSVSASFDDSTRGPYSNPWGTGLDLPADPTGSGRGRVARILYGPSSGGSMERGLAYAGSRIRYGQTIWFRGLLYIPSSDTGAWNSAHNRKLIDYQGGGVRMTLHRVGANDLKMSIVDWMKGYEDEVMDPSTGITLANDTWHTIEIKLTTNSADNVRDGVLEIYMNGATTPTFRQATGLGWITEKYPGGSYFDTYLIGFQLTIDSGDTPYTEYRYWDDVALASQRIPQ